MYSKLSLVTSFKIQLTFEGKEHALCYRGPWIQTSATKSLLRCGQKYPPRWRRCKRDNKFEEGRIPKLWRPPVQAFLFHWQHCPTYTSSPRAGMSLSVLPHSSSDCGQSTSATSPSPRQPQPSSLELPSSYLPRAQEPPPGTLAKGPYRSPIPFLSLQSILFNFVSLPFHSRISNSLSGAQKPSMAYRNQINICFLELAFQMPSHLSPTLPTRATSVWWVVNIRWLDGWVDGQFMR